MVIDWKRRELTQRCLKSLQRQEGAEAFEVVLVVNEADPADVEYFRRRFPDVVVVPEVDNRGFAGGVMAGLCVARGEVIALVNNDAVADDRFIAEGLAVLDSSGPQTAAVAARVRLEGRWVPAVGGARVEVAVARDGSRWERATSGSELMNGDGVAVDANGNGFDRGWLRPIDSSAPAEPLFGFSGGACFLRRAALDEIGGFDASLFMYYEDVDVSWRLRLAGHDIVASEHAVVVHRHAGSSSHGSGLVRYQSMRNRLAVVVRNGSVPLVFRVIGRVLARAVLDLLPGGMSQLEPEQWRRLLAELPSVVLRALASRRLDSVPSSRRRRVERLYLSR